MAFVERCLTSLSESFLKQSYVWNYRVLERTHQRDKESLHNDNRHHVIHLSNSAEAGQAYKDYQESSEKD